MNKGYILPLVAIIIFSFISQSTGEVLNHTKAGIKLTIPQNWKAKPTGNDLEISAPDETVLMFFTVIEGSEIDAVMKELEKELKKIMKNIKMGEQQEGTLNGMPIIDIEGTGEIEGMSIEWGVHIFKAKKFVMILSIMLPGWKKWEKTMEKFAGSIKKM